jgi:hypothetical protein
MKKIIFLILTSFILAEENLLLNGDFEKIKQDDKPLNWNISGKGEAVIDREIKYSGNSSLKLSLNEKGSLIIRSENFSVKPSQLYLITLWYKGEKFETDEPGYSGASASADIIFYTKEKKEIQRYDLTGLSLGHPWSIGFPYKNVKNWEITSLIVSSPSQADSAVFQINLGSNNKEVLPTIWIDNIWIREYVPSQTKGKLYIYEAEGLAHPEGEIVDDEEAENKKAVVAKKGKNKKGVIIYGLYTKDQPPGQYKILFRIKIDDNKKDIPVIGLKVGSDGFLNWTINTIDVKGKDFEFPDKYKEIPMEIIKPPYGYFDIVITWNGEVNVWVDNIKIIEEKVFDNNDMEELWK